MLDIAKYSILKTSGSITGTTISSDTITITSKQFDPNTGVALPDATSTFSLADMQEQIDYYQTQITNLDAIKQDCGIS